MKYVIAALIALFFILIAFLADCALKAYTLHISSDTEKSECLCHTMETYTDCVIRLHGAKAETQIKEKVSSCPTPHKPRQLLFDLLKSIVTAIVSTVTKILIERKMG